MGHWKRPERWRSGASVLDALRSEEKKARRGAFALAATNADNTHKSGCATPVGTRRTGDHTV